MDLWKRIWSVGKATATAWSDDKVPRLGAALAFYGIFSFGPLVIIAIAVAGMLFSESAASGEVYRHLQGFISDKEALAIENLIKATHRTGASFQATVISIVTLIVTATAVVVQLKDSLNSIWSVRAKPGKSIKFLIKDYLVAAAALVALGAVLVVSLVTSIVLATLSAYFGPRLPFSAGLVAVMNFLVSFGFVAVLSALIFKLLPDVNLKWRDVWIGAVGTSLLFYLGKTVLGFYLGRQTYDETYGAAAAFVLLMLWLYYLAQIFFLGAEFTKAYMLEAGRTVEPSRDAEVLMPPTAAPRAEVKPGSPRVVTT